MFIETLKNFVTTLVTALIFMSAIELIAPNKMKKYVKFVLGLILITIILNPVLQFIADGEKNVTEIIKNYENVISNEKDTSNFNNVNTLNSGNKNDSRKKEFLNNFNKNCDNILKSKFKDMNFKSEVECDVDFNNVTINIRKLRIGVSDNKINKIKKVVINKNVNEHTTEENAEYGEIVNFISNELNIPKEKIEVYKLEE